MEEADLLATLDAHDELVRRCAHGDLGFWDFEAQYNSLYARYPLDGHEGGAEGLLLLAKHASRVALHRELWELVLTKVLPNSLQGWAGRKEAAGRIDAGEALQRVKALAERHLR
jgi:hypothetical protein